MKKRLFLLPVLVLLFFFFNSFVYSQASSSHAQTNRPFLTVDQNGNPGAYGATGSALPGSASRSGILEQRISGIKLQVCQRLQENISKRSEGLITRASNIENIFDTHITAVENYYTTKLVPEGKTIQNYNILVADIQSQKTAVNSALVIASQDAASFSCTSSGPFAQMEQFRSDMLSVIQALNNYKKSVVSLIVTVANLGGVGTGNPAPTGSTVPTATGSGR